MEGFSSLIFAQLPTTNNKPTRANPLIPETFSSQNLYEIYLKAFEDKASQASLQTLLCNFLKYNQSSLLLLFYHFSLDEHDQGQGKVLPCLPLRLTLQGSLKLRWPYRRPN